MKRCLQLALLLVLQCFCCMSETVPFQGRLKKLIERFVNMSTAELNSNNTCPLRFVKDPISSRSGRIGHVVLLSVSGRVGSSNLLSMLNQGLVASIGEIFSEKMFHSRGLAPDVHSPKRSPAQPKHEARMIDHIRRAFNTPKSYHDETHKLASIKFWHAWINGVSLSWLVRQLFIHGCVSHFVLISQNPVRVVASEMYAHRHQTWRYEPKHKRAATCTRASLSYHIGGQWVSEMAVAQYQSFMSILQLEKEIEDIKTLGISYEADILPNPMIAYSKIASFLQLKLTSSENETALRSTHHKGLLCRLSEMLVNYDELSCTLKNFDQRNNVILNPLSWMSADDDMVEVTFTYAMQSWRRLWETIKWGRLTECSEEQLQRTSTYVRTAIAKMTPVNNGRGKCIAGGETALCRHLPAIKGSSLFCLLAMHRAGCDGFTFKNNNDCYLHSANLSDFNIIKCSPHSFYRTIAPLQF